MSSSKGTRPLNPQIREEAAAWFVAFCEEEIETRGRVEFNAWLRTSPEHVRAYIRISAFWEDAELFSKYQRREMDEIVQRALGETNVVPFDEGATARAPDSNVQPSRRRRYAIAATLAACAGAGLLAWFQFFRVPDYSTGAAEQRIVTLLDGSTVSLNARSRIKVKFSESLREVVLVEGQALFRVARNTARPFVVHADDTSVRAVGTAFDVYRKHGTTVVTVVEGRVAVSGSGSAPAARPLDAMHGAENMGPTPLVSGAKAPLVVSAGEQVVVTPDALMKPEPANAAAATAWTQGKLVFDSVPLSEVIDEFNRYGTSRIVVEDAVLRDTQISGAFSLADSGQFMEFLRQRFGIVSQETDDEVRIVRQ